MEQFDFENFELVLRHYISTKDGKHIPLDLDRSVRVCVIPGEPHNADRILDKMFYEMRRGVKEDNDEID